MISGIRGEEERSSGTTAGAKESMKLCEDSKADDLKAQLDIGLMKFGVTSFGFFQESDIERR